MSEIERAIDEIAAAQEQARRITLADGTQMSKEWISVKTLKLAETIMTAELDREKNPLTCDGCKYEARHMYEGCPSCARDGERFDCYERERRTKCITD